MVDSSVSPHAVVIGDAMLSTLATRIAGFLGVSGCVIGEVVMALAAVEGRFWAVEGPFRAVVGRFPEVVKPKMDSSDAFSACGVFEIGDLSGRAHREGEAPAEPRGQSNWLGRSLALPVGPQGITFRYLAPSPNDRDPP
jgi:hypothetical protein